MELADMQDLGSCAEMRWGSSPHTRTTTSGLTAFEKLQDHSFFYAASSQGGHGCLYAQTLPRLAGTASLESPSSDTVIVKAKLLASYGKVAPTLFASGFFRFTGSTGNTCICEFDIIIFFRQISVCFASGNC